MSHVYKDWRDEYTKVHSSPIGQGTFGKVFLVKSNQTQKYYAIKEINLQQPILKSSIINKSYALDEGLKLIKLNLDHENIVKYYKSYIFNDCIYWLMDYCDAGTLRDRINLYIRQNNKPIDENLIWYWSLQILKGIYYLHSKGLIHRDLNPNNIYLIGKRGVCKIGDFGFAKLLVDTSITDNTTIKYIKNFDFNGSNSLSSEASIRQKIKEEKVVYKLINMSQVGTPAYIAPELRMLIDSHLNFSSIATINERIKLCEKHILRGDIFSFGCILYEMTFLRAAFENKFQLEESIYLNKLKELDVECENKRSNDLKNLIKLCLAKNPEDRPNIKQLFSLSLVNKKLYQDFSDAYKAQIIPNLTINTKKNVLICISSQLEEFYKPVSMKSLKFNQNLIIILAIKHVNTNNQHASSLKMKNFKLLQSTLNTFSNPFSNNQSNDQSTHINQNYENMLNKMEQTLHNHNELTDPNVYYSDESVGNCEETKLLIYNEFGHLIKEFNSFLYNGTSTNRELFKFQIYDFCVDEENDHLYLSTRKYGILRFRIREQSYYLDDLIYDGQLDLGELRLQSGDANNNSNYQCLPICLNLIENEAIFKDSMRTTNKRRLLFYDRVSKRIISLQADLISRNSNQTCNDLSSNMIKCYLNAGLTLEQNNVRQMVSTQDELICIFDDLSLINVYNLKTLQLKRTNRLQVANNEKRNKSLKKNVMCLSLDSDANLYSTNGKSIFNFDYVDFKQKKRISPSIKKGENLSHTICWMTILSNSKLVLLTDALQMENSVLYILKPKQIEATTATTTTTNE
jgi:serine/threonine protein kinase